MPDILANAGGVTSVLLRVGAGPPGLLLEGIGGQRATEHIMVSSFEDVVRYAETHHVNNRIAAYMLAIDRVAYTIRQRGIYAVTVTAGYMAKPPPRVRMRKQFQDLAKLRADWDVERRYDLTGLRGSDMVTAINAHDGVLQWIKQHW